jgi:hypothetical protein
MSSGTVRLMIDRLVVNRRVLVCIAISLQTPIRYETAPAIFQTAWCVTYPDSVGQIPECQAFAPTVCTAINKK